MTAPANSPILVTGGTGTLGRLVVPRLRDAGHDVRVLSRHRPDDDRAPGVEHVTADLATGEGVEAALKGSGVVLHLAGSPKGDEDKARHLVEAAASAGTQHLVYISVVGADRVPMAGAIDRTMFGYFGQKFAAEKLIAESGVPWTMLRASQFHELVYKTAQALARFPVAPVPSGMLFQPIAAAEVADRLVELAAEAPAGMVAAMAGPATYTLKNLVHSYAAAQGKRRFILPLRLPGKAARAVRDGGTLAPDHAVGRQTWEEFLAAHPSS